MHINYFWREIIETSQDALIESFMYIFRIVLGVRVGGQCIKRSQSEAYHTQTFATSHQRRRGTGQSHQSYHRWRRCHSPHSQIPYW